jgi:hypothetical protein
VVNLAGLQQRVIAAKRLIQVTSFPDKMTTHSSHYADRVHIRAEEPQTKTVSSDGQTWQDKMELQDSAYNPHLSQNEMVVRETIYIPDSWVGAVIVSSTEEK